MIFGVAENLDCAATGVRNPIDVAVLLAKESLHGSLSLGRIPPVSEPFFLQQPNFIFITLI